MIPTPLIPRLLLQMLPCIAISSFASLGAESKPEYLPLDSRQWSRTSEAAIFSDLSKVEPQAALITGKRAKGKWKMIPFETADLKGTALSIYAGTAPPPIKLTLPAKGWHAVYIGLATTSGGFSIGGNGLKARLSGEPVFKRLANNLPLLENRRSVIQECYLTVANLDGHHVEIAPLPGLPATICYVKTVPLTELEASQALKPASPQTRTSIATFDGHSWIWPFRPSTAEELAEEFRGFEGTDIGKWWFQVLGADLTCYQSKVGNYPGEGTVDFPNGTYASYTRTLETLFKKGVNPLKVARDAARAQGTEFHVILRPAGWVGSMPYEETFNSKFYYAHPEWRCVDREGKPAFFMSYAVPEVRRHLLDLLAETLEPQPEGVGMVFNRGMPMILWEEAFSKRFQEKHKVDARSVPEDDPRIYALRAEIMTEFMQEIRTLLDETARRQNRKTPYKISLGTFSTEGDNQKFGIDLPNWISRGLVDDLGVAWFAYHTSFTQPDMAYYKRITEGTKVGVYPFVIAWKTGKPQEFCKKVIAHYTAGAKGMAIWDPQMHKGWPENSPGTQMDILGRLGHRTDVLRWARGGVPAPHSIPMTRLDENYFSKWFPNTGF